MKFVNLNSLNQKELLAMSNNTVATIYKYQNIFPAEILINLDTIAVKEEELRIHINNPRRFFSTAKINAADQHRTAIARDLVRTVKSAAKSTLPSLRSNALIIQAILDGFGNFREESLNIKTSSIKSLIKDINNNPVAFNAAKTMLVMELITGLNEANEVFAEIYAQRQSENIEKARFPYAKRELINLHKDFLAACIGYKNYKRDGSLDKFLQELQDLHAKFHALVARRKKPKSGAPKVFSNSMADSESYKSILQKLTIVPSIKQDNKRLASDIEDSISENAVSVTNNLED